MSDTSPIEWVRGDDGSEGSTWNPITGCSVISAGCKHCYAMKLAGTRLAHTDSRKGLTVNTSAGPVWNGQVRLNAAWLDKPLRWQRPRRIFVCAHGDLFHESVPDEWIDAVFGAMALAQRHTFMVLTKRADRMARYFEELPVRAAAFKATESPAIRRFEYVDGEISSLLREAFERLSPGPAAQTLQAVAWPLPNVWLGVSVENQPAAVERMPGLLRSPAAVHWVSVEPLLGPVSLTRIDVSGHGFLDALRPRYFVDVPPQSGIDWVVVGGESGNGARPMNPAWVLDLQQQCDRAGTAFFFKQWGAFCGGSGQASMWLHLCNGESPAGDSHTVEWPDGYVSQPMSKKRAGRTLFGAVHDAWPTP